MIIHIEPQSDIPIYTQLSNQIIEGIARGKLIPGDSLPSVRAFAADLGVNMHTVSKSYHQLEKKGIIRIVPKSGAIIRSTDELLKENLYDERFIDACKPVIAEALVAGLTREQIEALVSRVIDDFKGKT
ncbi:GntR family transcriptional regulator [Niallia endozanthoxylica]|uniref:GntR family transcriptional regulator n=1 Tax=Niallia endozanthoxylica TaxID=2036016 RepID=A0A5J5I4H0_9BACI|nr:GntR family transcriptional regulator [Niallia endozanthoxylica]KAA9029982.1 GntR family transcriptional regulator [Niallia endozanthoxylica]